MRILPAPLLAMPRYVAFRKGNQQRAQRFAMALQQLKNSGQLEAIYQRGEQ